MRDEDFDHVMDAWADQELESAPEMRPTERMVRMVQAKQIKKPWFRLPSAWVAAGVAVAALLVVTVVYTLFFSGPPATQEVAWVGLREGFPSESGTIVVGTAAPPDRGSGKGPTPPPEKGGKKGMPFPRRLEFHYQRPDSSFAEVVSLLSSPQGTTTLTSADNYRLVLEPDADQYVVVYQLSPPGNLTRLFPNDAFSPTRNPLRPGQTLYLPAEPNWFYLGQGTGKERLIVIASMQPLQELEDLYARYRQADDAEQKEEILAELLALIESTIQTRSEETAAWVFVFDHQ